MFFKGKKVYEVFLIYESCDLDSKEAHVEKEALSSIKEYCEEKLIEILMKKRYRQNLIIFNQKNMIEGFEIKNNKIQLIVGLDIDIDCDETYIDMFIAEMKETYLQENKLLKIKCVQSGCYIENSKSPKYYLR